MYLLNTAIATALMIVTGLAVAADGAERSITHNRAFADRQVQLEQHRVMHDSLAKQNLSQKKNGDVRVIN